MNGTEVTALPSGYGVYLLQTLLALGAVCLLAYVVLRFGLTRLYGGGRRSDGKLLRVVERLPLDPRRSLYLVEVAGRHVLLGTGDSGVRFLTTVETGAALDRDGDAPASSDDDVGASASSDDESPPPE